MDPTTAFIAICLLGIGGCIAWYVRGWIEEQTTAIEFDSEDDDDEGQ